MGGGADPEAKTLVAPLTDEGNETLDESPMRVAQRYELLGLLGAGAMGTVYRARDRELDETIALKVLKKELASSHAMLERFRREVKLARRVTHRNVARVFDIGENDGDRFLTMELIDGEMLGSVVARRGVLPVPEVIAIARDVCAGLAAAHAAGVLHRDLKPENVILARDGRAVITDFGIARALEGDLGRTASIMVGTPAYMAPEQVEGAPDLDARADLYALGTMLFELITGQTAWTGDSIVTLAAARLLRPPPDVRSVAKDVPADLAELVLSLMARSRHARPQSAEAVSARLEALAPPASLPPSSVQSPKTRGRSQLAIAILPLSNLGDPADAYLAGNVTEDIVDLLSMVKELRVRPRADTRRFAGDAREAGRALGVDVIVDGSLRRIGDSVRVAVRLVTVEDGFQLWARRFDRPAPQVLAIADDAARAIARTLTTELSSGPRGLAADPVAQDLFLRGRHLLNRGWFEVNQEAIDFLRRARELAPKDARIAAHYALALARASGSSMDARSAADARDAAQQARALDADLPEVWVANAMVALQAMELTTAVYELRRALDAAPTNVEALDWYARLLTEVGRYDHAIELARRALAIDPEMLHARFQIAHVHSARGDREAMLEELGPQPEQIGDLMPWLLIQGREIIWRRDRAAASRLLGYVKGLPLTQRGVTALHGMLGMTAEGRMLPEIRSELESLLPVAGDGPSRRCCFNAQLRTELALATGELDLAEQSLRAADANLLADICWFEHCSLFDGHRQWTPYVELLANTRVRAEKVLAAIDAPLPVLANDRVAPIQ